MYLQPASTTLPGIIMSYLEELLGSLTKEELSKLHSLKLSPSERSFLKKKLQLLQGQGAAKPESLASTDQYLYKLRSVLLNKILAHIAGKNDIEVLQFLQRRNLRSLTLRQAKLADQKTGRFLKGTEKELFYRHLFQIILPWYEQQFDEALITEYANKYAEARVTPLADEHLFLDAHLLYYRSFPDRLSVERERRTKEFIALEKAVRNSPNIEAQFVALRGLIMLLRSSRTPDIPRAIELTDRMLEIMECNPFYFSSRSFWGNQLIKAELTMLKGNIEEAYAVYRRLLRSDPTHNNSGGYHEIRYFFACIYTGRFDEARVLLDTSDSANLWLTQISPSDLQICRIAFELLQNNTEEAISLISRFLQRENHQGIVVTDEYYIRALEVCCIILQRDYRYAEALIRRHLKFGEYHSKQLRFSVIPSFFRLLHPIIEELQGKKVLRESHLKKFESFRTGTESHLIYCLYLLLIKMRGSQSQSTHRPML